MSQIQEPIAEYARRRSAPADAPGLFGPPPTKGTVTTPAPSLADTPAVYYTHPHGRLWLGDAVTWLRSLPADSVDLAFFDPPNGIKKAEWDTLESQQEYVRWSLQWIEQAARVLKPTGTLYICGLRYWPT